MRHILPITAIALMLGTAPLAAQDATGTTPTDPVLESEDAVDGEDTTEVEGEFSRKIPEGLKANLTEEELADYQARLDATTTPQERNAVRQELQSLNKERHLEQVQKNKPKGFFESITADFKSLGNGKASSNKSSASGDKSSKGKSAGSGGGKDKGGRGKGGKNK